MLFCLCWHHPVAQSPNVNALRSVVAPQLTKRRKSAPAVTPHHLLTILSENAGLDSREQTSVVATVRGTAIQ